MALVFAPQTRPTRPKSFHPSKPTISRCKSRTIDQNLPALTRPNTPQRAPNGLRLMVDYTVKITLTMWPQHTRPFCPTL